jgi:hypothetical protein
MIVIDFDPEYTKTVASDLLNTEIERREPNFILFKYKKIMSLIFFIASIVNIFVFSTKIYFLKLREIGAVKGLVFVNLLCLVIYNFLYIIGTADHWASTFMDNLINSLMMALVLFLNLVLIDSLTDKTKQQKEFRPPLHLNKSEDDARPQAKKAIRAFFGFKVLICFSILITLHFFMYTHSARLLQYVTSMSKI